MAERTVPERTVPERTVPERTVPERTGPERTVTRGLRAVLRVPGHPDLLLPALLRYAAHDPWAVRMVLLLEPDDDGGTPESVEWVLGRELLAAGLTGSAAADGACVRAAGRDHLLVELAAVGSDARAAALLPRADVAHFLDAAFAAVPAGTEPAAASAALDRAVEALLS